MTLPLFVALLACGAPPEPTPTPEPPPAVPQLLVPGVAPWAGEALQSAEGRPIEVHRFGPDKGEAVLVVAGFHGDEPQAAWLGKGLLRRLEQLPVDALSRPVVLLPLLNPDGAAADTRGNAQGVDLNRNWPTRDFGNGAPGDRYYSGPTPLSEPESRALAGVLNAVRPTLVVSIHAPLAAINYDGPAAHQAEVLAEATGLPVRADLGAPTPGSLGTLIGDELGIPILTVELPKEPGTWSAHGEPLLGTLGITAPLRVALTFDDLPYQTIGGGKPLYWDHAIRAETSRGLLAALDGRPATVFVNCAYLKGPEGAELVQAWRDAGAIVANHTARHVSADQVSPEHFGREIVECDKLVDRMWLRFPYLRRGKDEARRDRVASTVKAAGYRHIPVTVATSDWLLAARYDETTDPERRAALEAALVDHVVASIEAARDLSLDKLGRDVPHILLLHVNQLGAARLADVIEAIETRGWKLIGVDEALEDPLYAQPDAVAVPAALSWLLRVAPPWKPGEPNWFGQAEAELHARFPPAPPPSE